LKRAIKCSKGWDSEIFLEELQERLNPPKPLTQSERTQLEHIIRFRKEKKSNGS